jgi:putative ABC transport system permease protein
MFRNYFRTAIRFIKRNKAFAGINALGLSIALAASFIILLYVINELSYNHMHKNRKHVYRVVNYYEDFKMTMSGTPYVLASVLKEEFPQVEKAVRARRILGFRIKLKDDLIDLPGAVATDSEVFDIFTLPLVYGPSHENLLDDRNSIVLSQSISQRLFPGQDPVGKEITGMVDNEEHLFVVRGVFRDIPQNSTFTAQCLVNSKWTLEPINKTFNISNAESDWTMDFWTTWVRLSGNSDPAAINGQFKAFETKHISEDPHKLYSLQTLSYVYLRSENVANSGIQGSLKNIRLFSGIAFLIIIVATINYIILSTAVSTGRSKEIGIRKTFGAGNKTIRDQILSESVALSMTVLPVSLIFAWFSMPYAGRLFQTRLNIINANIPLYICAYLVLALLIGLASGIYASGYLSRLRVIDVLKNTSVSGKSRHFFRSVLIVAELIIFCTFVSAAMIIRSQYRFAVNKNPGYINRDILLVDLGRDFKGYSSFINSLRTSPNVISAGGTMASLPMQGSMSSMYPHFQEKEKLVNVEGMAIDFGFLGTMGIKLIEGRDFSPDFGSDLTQSCILNETAVRALGIVEPVGKKLGSYTIIGIAKDFNLHSIHKGIPPISVAMTDRYIEQVAVHYRKGTLTALLPFIESEWKKVAPDKPFSYTTIEDLTKDIYSSERNLTSIISIFGLFTLVIAAFGLFGLTLYVSRSRTREIGVKKVFGSSGKRIIASFLKENLILVTVAAVLSIPVTLYFMNGWLKNFAYKISISWWIFMTTFLLAAIVVLMTVFFHSYKASRTDPVTALKYE